MAFFDVIGFEVRCPGRRFGGQDGDWVHRTDIRCAGRRQSSAAEQHNPVSCVYVCMWASRSGSAELPQPWESTASVCAVRTTVPPASLCVSAYMFTDAPASSPASPPAAAASQGSSLSTRGSPAAIRRGFAVKHPFAWRRSDLSFAVAFLDCGTAKLCTTSAHCTTGTRPVHVKPKAEIAAEQLSQSQHKRLRAKWRETISARAKKIEIGPLGLRSVEITAIPHLKRLRHLALLQGVRRQALIWVRRLCQTVDWGKNSLECVRSSNCAGRAAQSHCVPSFTCALCSEFHYFIL